MIGCVGNTSFWLVNRNAQLHTQTLHSLSKREVFIVIPWSKGFSINLLENLIKKMRFAISRLQELLLVRPTTHFIPPYFPWKTWQTWSSSPSSRHGECGLWCYRADTVGHTGFNLPIYSKLSTNLHCRFPWTKEF